MIHDKLMKLIDDYACEVANAPSSPTPTERNLATERIERARKAVVTELAKPAPTQPAWHDAPNAPGLWLRNEGDREVYTWVVYAVSSLPRRLYQPDGETRWFGPIPLPEDTK